MSDVSDVSGPGVATAALPSRLFGSIVALSPTAVWNWTSCRRRYLLRNLVQLPRTDEGRWTDEGRKVHAVLHQLHRDASCHDTAAVDDLVAGYGGENPERLHGYLRRHAVRCPKGATYLGGELPLARFHREPPPLYTMSGSIDAVWVHDGLLDARDYKTGVPGGGDVADDVRARAQAWLLAPLAAERGLRLRVRYEYLAPEATEDPAPFDPEPDRLAAVEDELAGIVESMRAEREFAGVSDPQVCGWCEYRSVCRDAAT